MSLLAVAALARAEPLVSSTTRCDEAGRLHTTTYSVDVAGNSFVDLDGADLAPLLESVTCDVDETRLALKFKHRADATEWYLKFHDFNSHFIVGGKQWNCTTSAATPTFILRRVMATQGFLDRTLSVRTSMARYDEVFSDADITYGVTTRDAACASAAAAKRARATAALSSPLADHEVDHEVCIGANADCHGGATAPLPLYSGAGGALTATCTDCFAALTADLYVSVRISRFQLEHFELGLRNTSLDASMQIDAHAAKSTTLAVEKSLSLVPTTTLIDFKVGSVPFMIFLDVPMDVNAELDFAGQADLRFGAAAHLAFGEVALRWNATSHWTHSVPRLTHDITPSLSTSAALTVGGRVSLTPKFILRLDRMLTFTLTASPRLDATVAASEGAAKDACISSTYALGLTAAAELDININVIDFHKDWTYGPQSLATYSGIALPKTCVKL